MRKIGTVPICLAFLLLCAGARAEVWLQVAQTDPPASARLRPGEAFYARVLYDTDRPIRIFGRARGAAADARGKSHASPLYGPGPGQALVWFALDVPMRVQAMRLTAVEEQAGREIFAIEVPLALEWTRDAPARSRAAWVEPLARDQQARIRNAAAPEYGAGVGLLTALLFGSVPGYLVAQAFALWHLRGRWSAWVWAPAAAMGALYLFVIVAGLAGSNLAPIWVVFLSPLALLYVIVLLIRDWRRRPG